MSFDTSQQIIWHTQQWQSIGQMLSQQRFPHALLLEGSMGLGKALFAAQLSQLLLCQSTDSETGICQTCSSCKWFTNEAHPDFAVLRPEEGKKLISVESIRLAISKVFQTSHQSGYRILLVDPADAMTVAAANSLLKTLEEPPAQTLILLVTDKPTRLLPTIRSRATKLKFLQPKQENAIDWLNQQGLERNKAEKMLSLSRGAPMRFSSDEDSLNELLKHTDNWWEGWLALHAKTLSPVDMAKQWKGVDSSLLLSWLEGLLAEYIKRGLSDESVDTTPLFPGFSSSLHNVQLKKLFLLRDRVLGLLQKTHTSLNWGLQLESLAIECSGLTR